MSVPLLTEHYLSFLSLKEGCPGLSESTLVKMPHCWKSHVAAHMDCQNHKQLKENQIIKEREIEKEEEKEKHVQLIPCRVQDGEKFSLFNSA